MRQRVPASSPLSAGMASVLSTKTAHKEGRTEERGCQQKRHSQGKKSKNDKAEARPKEKRPRTKKKRKEM